MVDKDEDEIEMGFHSFWSHYFVLATHILGHSNQPHSYYHNSEPKNKKPMLNTL